MLHQTQPESEGFTTVDLDLTIDQQLFVLRQLCSSDLRPSEWLSLVVNEYIDSNPGLREAFDD